MVGRGGKVDERRDKREIGDMTKKDSRGFTPASQGGEGMELWVGCDGVGGEGKGKRGRE